MSSQSITNKLVANIKQTTPSNITTINNEKVICIDSSKNAIGINTLYPEYSLTISGNRDNSYNGIKAPYLYITNSGFIEELSSNYLFLEDSSINRLDFSFGLFNTISGNLIKANTISISNINFTGNYLKVNTISCEDLSVNNLEVLTKINCTGTEQSLISKLRVDDLSISNLDISNQNLRFLTVDTCANIRKLICQDLSVNGTISCEFLNVLDNLTASGIFVENGLTISGDLSVNGSATFTTISANSIDVSGSNLNNFVRNIATSLLKDLSDVSFGNVDISGILDMSFSNSQIRLGYDTSINNGNLQPNYLKIPTSQPLSNTDYYIAFNDNSNVLSIGDNKLRLKDKIVYLECNNNVIGQKLGIDFSPSINGYAVSNYNFVKLNTNIPDVSNVNNYSFKYIPLSIENSNSDDFSVNDISSLTINGVRDFSFELHANVSLQFYNKIANDVELNNYVFGVHDILGTTSNVYSSIKNSIMVFDNSFNYANSNINYYGSFKNGSNNNSKLQFFVGSIKDNSFIYIDSFHATIKMNY